MFYTPDTSSPVPMRYTYEELRALAVKAPAKPVGDEAGSYIDSPMGLYVGLHTHTGLTSVHVIVGDPTRLDVPHRKLAVVEPDRTDILLDEESRTAHQTAVLALLPGPFFYKGDDPKYLYHV